ncbi:envelope stress response protein PspG [Vibrio ruber]|uniref:Phage shock protein G n=1 Tax=Vibrio ruber (strain DSM 16370 / JCM 11486 / BCRC 17186 / CECT 7878 / LMG 23124 / VR1) TaxID=1123498 RepID=A0A1R4LUD7_VIBR1|nr:envelope stress response protein PspG [Vibrio ruber]WNJ94144.1 envelope stress response protein PspG [Vibrio ruber]SJN60108.1 phage shock protein G [Vibrio ruber DSM 16370]
MMVEVLYLLIFAGVLFFTGVTLFGVLLSIGLSFLFVLAFGMFAMFIKMLPWLLLIMLGVWLWKKLT